MLFVVGFVLSIVVCCSLLLFVVVVWNLSVFLDRMLAPLSSIPDKRNCTRLLLGWKMHPRESSVQCTWDAAAEPVWAKCLESFGAYTQWHLTIMWITDIPDVEEIGCKTTVYVGFVSIVEGPSKPVAAMSVTILSFGTYRVFLWLGPPLKKTFSKWGREIDGWKWSLKARARHLLSSFPGWSWGSWRGWGGWCWWWESKAEVCFCLASR